MHPLPSEVERALSAPRLTAEHLRVLYAHLASPLGLGWPSDCRMIIRSLLERVEREQAARPTQTGREW